MSKTLYKDAFAATILLLGVASFARVAGASDAGATHPSADTVEPAGKLAARDAGLLALTVDATKPLGRLKPMAGVNGPPISNRNGGINVVDAYKEAHISLVRIHDAGAGDIDSVFPKSGRPFGVALSTDVKPQVEENANAKVMFPRADADPDDPASYNFGPTDQLVQGIRAAGAEPLFRLGRSAGAEADPPKNFGKYARIAAHIVRHYNQGWANGFHYGIEYWEVWNEPDFKYFWLGTPDQYYELYDKVARAVKGADPNAKIGGPTQALPLDTHPYGEAFLAYARAHQTPLDFFSWHWYSGSNDPYDLVRLGKVMRARLDKYGFRKTLSFCDEWNSSVSEGGLGINNSTHAAYIGAALAYLEAAPVDQEALYRVDDYFAPQRLREGSVLTAWGWMQDTPRKLAVLGNRTDGFAAVAGKSQDGKLIQVFVSDYRVPDKDQQPLKGPPLIHIPGEGTFHIFKRQAFHPRPDNGYALTLTGLPPGAHVVNRYRISDTNNLDLVETKTVSGPTVVVNSDLSASGVELLKISSEP